MSSATACSRRPLLDGAGSLIEFGTPPGNVLDGETLARLGEALDEAAADPELKFLVLRGSGKHFSFGASVPEHLPDRVEGMLVGFHAFLRAFDERPLPPLIAAVQGQCLGGGFELALACDLIAAAEDATLGCPEIKLGVFPPAGSALLPLRLSGGESLRLLLAGDTLSGREAAARGLAEFSAPRDELLARIEKWAREKLLPLSASSLRHGRWAARWPWRDALGRVLPELEERYLRDLQPTADAVEGIQAFLDKRTPEWRNR